MPMPPWRGSTARAAATPRSWSINRRLTQHGAFMRRIFVLLLSILAASATPVFATMDTSAEHALLMDAGSGQVLWQKDGLVPMPPASMSKLMTLELLFQRLSDGRMKLTDTLSVSQR